MDEVDAVPRPRRQRPKDSFQSELQAKLHQRKSLGLTAEVTDSDDDGLSSSRTKDFMKRGATRPSAAKRRPDHSPDLSRGLGTTTMRARDLSSLLGRSVSDDEDEEVMAANLGKASPGGTWQPGSLKTPSPKQDSLFARKTPTRDSPKEQSGRLESIYGRKTPTKDVSPRSGGLSKEDIIFGRKTPVDGKKSPHDGSLRKLPGVDGGDKPWQPPNFRSASPGSSEHSRGSRGVTPVDATLDTISETPREKVTPRIQRGQKSETSPRALALEDRPKPQARSRVSERKTPPLVDPRRTSPTAQTSKDGALRRASPSFDLFGGRGRAAAAQEVDEYIDKDKQGKEEKLYGGRHALRRSPSPDSKKKELEALGRASPSRQGSGRFSKDGRKTPTDRKTPTGVDRKTPTSFDRKTPSSLDRKTPTSFDRKTPTGQRQKTAEETDKEILQEKAAAMKGSSLLDFLTEDTSQAKPKPQARKNRSRDTADDDLDDIFAANKKLLGKSAEVRRSTEGRKSPGIVGRKSPELSKRSSASFEDGETPKPRTIPKQQRPEDASSICDEIPLDPNRKVHADTERATRLGKQSSEKAKAEAAIDSIAEAQTMQYIEPAKKVRPVTAHAKVQHRPKPRYGALPGTQTLQERQFNSTGDIRDAIYEDWYNERLKSARIKKKEEERQKKEKEGKEQKEKREKRLEAEASYRAWMEKKKEVLKVEEEKKKRAEKDKEMKEKEEREEKMVESVKSFQSWKEKKDHMIKRELRKKEQAEQRAKEDEEYEKKMKNKERESAFRGWQRRKEKEWKSNANNRKEENKTKKEKDYEEKEVAREKEEEAMNRYYEWMEQKEKQAKLEKKRAKQRRLMGEDEYKPAWSPASKTIPFGS